MNDSGGHYSFVGNDPKRVDKAVDELSELGITLLDFAGDVHRDTASIKEAWPKGHTGQLAARDAERMGKSLDECSKAFKVAATALDGLVQPLVAGRTTVRALNASYQTLSAALSAQTDHLFEDYLYAGNGGGGGVLLPEETRQQNRAQKEKDDLSSAQNKTGYHSLAEIDTAYKKVVADVTEHSDQCNRTLMGLTDHGRAPANHGHAVGETMYDVSFNILSAMSAPQVADILSGRTPFPTEPKAVHDAWMELSADQQMHLLNNDPARFGNLNGIPAKDRDTANKFVLKNEVHQIGAALEAAGLPTTSDPEVLEKWDAEGQIERIQGRKNPVRDAITNAGISFDQAKHTLRVNAELQHPDEGVEVSQVHLLAYQPGADDENGRAAIAYGDVDSADNVAVCVPGLNSTLGNFQNVSGDGQHLFKAAQKTDPSKQTAVIAWQGYDAPNFLEVADQDHAEIGSKLLAADVNALRVTHDGPIKGKLTVVAHSYGSTTASLAFQHENMHADQGVFIGSPGMGGAAKTAADLGLDRNTMFTGAASRDAVTTGTRHFGHSLGADPTVDDFGATRFKTENVGRGDHINLADHSLYYDENTQSESLHSLSRIVTGYGHTLRQEGMLAEPRHTVVHENALGEIDGVKVIDRESSRAPTSGHANTQVIP